MTSINFYERTALIKRIENNLNQINQRYFDKSHVILSVTDNGDYLTVKKQGVYLADYDTQKLFDALENFIEEVRELLSFPYDLWDYLDYCRYTPEDQNSDNLSKLVEELETKNEILEKKNQELEQSKEYNEAWIDNLKQKVHDLESSVWLLQQENKRLKNQSELGVKMTITMVKIPASQEIKSFRIGKYPVTQEQYQAVMGVNPSHFQGNPQNPVESVSYDDAQAFCEKLSQITGKNYRLPTVSEWEYACRAGTVTGYYFGDDYHQLRDYAWYFDNSQGTTHPVGLKLPNAWGLYDMHGNVWEWCQKDFHLRGGSWGSLSTFCRSAFRYSSLRRDDRTVVSGFRVVCDN
jgi:hypothetical protein